MEKYTIKQFMDEIKKMYDYRLPFSGRNVNFIESMGKNEISIEFYLSSEKRECKSSNLENDMFNIKFIIYPYNLGDVKYTVGFPKSYTSDSEITDYLNMEVISSNYIISANCQKCKYGYRELPYNRIDGKPNKILGMIGQYIDILFRMLGTDIKNNNIHIEYTKLVNEKINYKML